MRFGLNVERIISVVDVLREWAEVLNGGHTEVPRVIKVANDSKK